MIKTIFFCSDQIIGTNESLLSKLSYLPLLLVYRHLCPGGMLLVGWWPSSPRTEAKETLYSVLIELRFYSRPVVFATLIVSTRPDAASPLVVPQ